MGFLLAISHIVLYFFLVLGLIKRASPTLSLQIVYIKRDFVRFGHNKHAYLDKEIGIVYAVCRGVLGEVT